MKRIVVVGIGNILLKDEGVGVHVINELKKYSLPKNVEIHECGVRGFVVLNLLDGADKAVIIDAMKLGKKPGSICRLRWDESMVEDKKFQMMCLHDLDFITAMKIGRPFYRLPRDIIIIGIEPKTIESGLELSPEVKKAIPRVIQLILEEVKT